MRKSLLTLTLLVTLATPPAGAQEVSLGKPVSDFRLPNILTGKDVRLSDLKDRIVVVIFYSHTCTFCRNYEARFRTFAAEHVGKGVAVLAIDSTGGNAVKAATAWREKNMGFPLLRDDRAHTAAALGATALTTVCIVDHRGLLRYHGAFDDSESGKEIRCRFVADGVAALLAGKSVQQQQTDVYGCMIPMPR